MYLHDAIINDAEMQTFIVGKEILNIDTFWFVDTLANQYCKAQDIRTYSTMQILPLDQFLTISHIPHAVSSSFI